MYTRHEASRIKQEFWTTFGRYMAPVPSFSGEPVNWQNYKTGVKHVYLKKEAGAHKAYIALEILDPDPEERKKVFALVRELDTDFREDGGMPWTWEEAVVNEDGRTISRVYRETDNVNIFRKETWPQLISFFKQNMVLLDRIWSILKMTRF